MAHPRAFPAPADERQLLIRHAEDISEPIDRRELALPIPHDRDLRATPVCVPPPTTIVARELPPAVVRQPATVVIPQVHVVCDHGAIIGALLLLRNRPF